MLSQEIERLNGILRSKVDEVNNIENRLRNVQNENEDLRRKLNESYEFRKQIESYEGRISSMTSEIDRMNAVLRTKTEELTGMENRIRGLTQENDSLRRGNS